MSLKEELGRLYYLKKEAVEMKRRLRELECRATGCVRPVTGMPGGSLPADTTGDYAAALVTLREELTKALESCLREIEVIHRFVAGIEDSLMRLIITYRYINGYSWAKIAMLLGGGNTPDGVRMAHNRFLARCEKNKNVRSVR